MAARYQERTSCTINGATCGGGGTNELPEAAVTGPEDGEGIASVRPVRLTAAASDPVTVCVSVA